MSAIYIPQLLKAPEKTEVIQVQEFIPGLETLTPVRGTVVVTHRGTYLEVAGKAETIVTLTCDRTLRQYNHRLVVDTTELIWLDENANSTENLPLEREVKSEDLSESLSPQGYFQVQEWLYEQLCLALPLRQLSDEEGEALNYQEESQIDRRWAALEALKKQLS
ncbi:MAG: YceD family protein [Oscillatoria sp. PMC 1051.18]|nr:YceD family protein [Oscillatoria sp. PMC 1050.18]MEC5031762.1 YceD family protein [Oscillatoria sp. PMC 1051.18]